MSSTPKRPADRKVGIEHRNTGYGKSALTPEVLRTMMQLKFLEDANRRFFCGIDWGNKKDHAALATFDVETDGVMHLHDVVELPTGRENANKDRFALPRHRKFNTGRFTHRDAHSEVARQMFNPPIQGLPEQKSIIDFDFEQIELRILAAFGLTKEQIYGGPMEPKCPACGGQMVRRETKRGLMTGMEFWGCKAFPNCCATRTLEEATGELPHLKEIVAETDDRYLYLQANGRMEQLLYGRQFTFKQLDEDPEILDRNFVEPLSRAVCLAETLELDRQLRPDQKEMDITARVHKALRVTGNIENLANGTTIVRWKRALDDSPVLNKVSPKFASFTVEPMVRHGEKYLEIRAKDTNRQTKATLRLELEDIEGEMLEEHLEDFAYEMADTFRGMTEAQARDEIDGYLQTVNLSQAILLTDKEQDKAYRQAVKMQQFGKNYGAGPTVLKKKMQAQTLNKMGKAGRAAAQGMKSLGKAVDKMVDKMVDEELSASAHKDCRQIGKTFSATDKECTICKHKDQCQMTTNGPVEATPWALRELDRLAAVQEQQILEDQMNQKTQQFAPGYCKKCGHANGCMCSRDKILVDGMPRHKVEEKLIEIYVNKGMGDQWAVRRMVKQMDDNKLRAEYLRLTCKHQSGFTNITRKVAFELGYDVPLELKEGDDYPLIACRHCHQVFPLPQEVARRAK